MKTLPISILASALFLVGGEARAQEAPIVVESGVPTAVVSYADLNLASPAGRFVLERRASHAASNLCIENNPLPIEQVVAQRLCYSAAMSRARIDIERAVLRAEGQLALEGSIKVAAR
jgi:UrcA family protein